jgi:hypothetical protein
MHYLAFLTFAAPTLAIAQTIGLFYEQNIAQIEFAAGDIKTALEDQNYSVELHPLTTLTASYPNKKIVIALASNSKVTDVLLSQGGDLPSESGEQAYSLHTTKNPQTSYWVIGGDENGAMYGGLHIAENIITDRMSGNYNLQESPFMLNRGMKLNMPLDRRIPTYVGGWGSNSTKQAIPHVWDMTFWQTLIDQQARYRYNVLTVWTHHPFPALVKVDDYPNASLPHIEGFDGFVRTDLTHEKRVEFWREVMRYAHSRGMKFYFFHWNLYLDHASSVYPSLTRDPSNQQTIDYMYKSMTALLETYPELDGWGLSAGDGMTHFADNEARADWTWASVGKAVADHLTKNPDREFNFIHRGIYASPSLIKDKYKQLDDLPNSTLDYSVKYAQAHMYSTPTPRWTGAISQVANLGMKTWATIRNDSYFYINWGDPQFVRDYMAGIPEKQAVVGMYIGADGYSPSRTYFCKDPNMNGQLEVERRWYMEMLWGRISYNPQISDNVFKNMLAKRFPTVNSNDLFQAWTLASRPLPKVTELIMRNWALDFQWYPEACYSEVSTNPSRGGTGFRTIEDMATTDVARGSDLCNIANSAIGMCHGNKTSYMLADEIQTDAEKALEYIDLIGHNGDPDVRMAINNIKQMAYLSLYYSFKIRGATYKEAGEIVNARREMGKAYCVWIKYSSAMDEDYYGDSFRNVSIQPDWKFVDDRVLQEYTDLGGTINYDCSNPFPWINIVSPGSNKSFMEPASIILESVADAGDNSIEKVELRINDILIDTKYEAPYNFNLDSLLLGDYKIEIRLIDNHGESAIDSIRIMVNNDETFNQIPWIEDFVLPDGTRANTGQTTWTATRSSGIFEVRNNRLFINQNGPEAIFQSSVIDISGESVSASLDVAFQGGVDNGQDYVKFYIKIDQGPEELVGFLDGKKFNGVELNPMQFITMQKDGIVGNTIQLIAKCYVTFGDEYYYIDKISVDRDNPVENLAPQINITSPLNNAEFDQFSDIKFEMIASDPDGTLNRVELRVNGTLVSILKEETYYVILSNLKPGNNHIVASAFDNKGASANSAINILINPITRLNQYITFPDLPILHLGDADFDPGATSSSGNKVSYRSSNTNVATIRDEKIQIVGLGIAIITAMQAGDSKYNPAEEASKVLIVREKTSTGIDDLSSQILIHPNPAKKEVNIYAPNNYSLSLINMNGIEVLQKKNLHGTTQIDLTNFSKGVYFIKLTQHEHINIKKLILN